MKPKNINVSKPLHSVRGSGLLIAASLLSTGSIAHAATESSGLYLDFFGGFSGLSNGNLIQSGATSKGNYDGGTIVGMALGKHLNKDWDLEAEWFYRSNEISSVTGGAFNGVSEGDFASTNLMFNALYNFYASDKIKLYCGLGVGLMQEVDIDMTIGGGEQEFSDNWVLAAQLILGASYPINASFSATAEVRYHYASSPDLEASNGGSRLKADYSGYSALIGLRYSF
jgi:opacity protein-like surface antigen